MNVTLRFGASTISWPVSSADFVFQQRENQCVGAFIAVDTTGTGHNTSYPSNQETRALQIPFTNGIIPPHVVVADGACTADQIVTASTTL